MVAKVHNGALFQLQKDMADPSGRLFNGEYLERLKKENLGYVHLVNELAKMHEGQYGGISAELTRAAGAVFYHALMLSELIPEPPALTRKQDGDGGYFDSLEDASEEARQASLTEWKKVHERHRKIT